MTSKPEFNEESMKIPFGDKTIDAILVRKTDYRHETNGGIILTHGAGGDMNTPQLAHLAQHLASSDFHCVRFTCKALNLKYRIKVYTSVVKYLVEKESWTWCIIGGRSMGARAAISTANEFHKGPGKPTIKGVACLSYPLHPPKDENKLRDDILRDCKTPVLFISGTQDSQCNTALMEDTIKAMRNAVTMHWMDRGDHGLNVKGQGKSETITEICTTVSDWCTTTEQSPSCIDSTQCVHMGDAGLPETSTSKKLAKKRVQKKTNQKDTVSKCKKKK